jgi:germination protein M
MVNKRRLLGILFIVLAAFLGGCADKAPTPSVAPDELIKNDQAQGTVTPSAPTPATPSGQETMVVTVYNATDDAKYLVAEPHVVPKNDQPAKTAMELLTAGTKTVGLVSVMPSGTKLRNISIKDKVAYVDFNDKLTKNNSGGSTSETLLVAAIVNTLTEFKEIQKVQIMVDGKKIDTISGHLDLGGGPLSRSDKIIKK